MFRRLFAGQKRFQRWLERATAEFRAQHERKAKERAHLEHEVAAVAAARRTAFSVSPACKASTGLAPRAAGAAAPEAGKVSRNAPAQRAAQHEAEAEGWPEFELMASAIAGFVCQLRDGGEGLSEE